MAKKLAITIFGLAFIVLTFLLGSIIILLGIILRFQKEKVFFLVSRMWSKGVLFVSGVQLKITGLENTLFDSPKIFVSNHQGNYDIPILIAALPVHFRFLVKKELFKIPFFGWHLRGRGDILIDRQSGQKAHRTLSEVSKLVKSGIPVLIFPEGTRSLDGKIHPFKRGSMLVASLSKAKIVPIAISGSFNIQKKGSFFINPSKVILNIGKPVEIEKAEGFRIDQDKLLLDIQSKVISLFQK